MAFLNYEGLKRYDKKTKKYIKDKISEASLNGGTVDLSEYATKEELKNHTDDTNLHVTSVEKNTWNAKLDNSDLTNYATKTYVTDEIAKASTGGTVDLTGYAKTADVNTKLDTKVDKVTGKSLISDAEITRLSKISNYDDTSIKTSIANINSKLDTKANKSELFSGSYNALTNKPSINGITLTGDKSLSDLGIDLSRYTTTDKAVTSIELVDAIPTGSTGTTTEKCLRLTFADGTTVVNVSVNDLVGSDEKQKAIVCIIDDDGTNRTSDAYTGMTTWLNDKGIPMNFAVCHDTIGTSGKYTVTQLQDLQAKGNDILVHGNPKLTTLADETEVISEIESALQFHTSNGLKPTNIYVYPQGLNSDGTLTAKQVKEIVGRYFDYALNVNIASMSGEDTRGLWNKVPLVDKLNIARMEVSSTKGFDANKSKIDACIENKGLLILFTHSFQSQFTSGGYDEFKKIINYLSTKDVEFLTVSKALDKVEKIVKNYDDTQVKKDIADLQNNKVDKTSILSTISSNPSDDKLLSEKAIYNALLNNSSIYDDSETEKYFHNTSAHEFVNMLSPAVNLGNTLDCHLNTEHPTAPDTIIGWETLWKNVETTKEIMETYKKAGFKTIRIPVTWYEHMDVNGVIASEWLARVKTIVDWAIESGLYVIINAHHDTNSGDYINAVASDYETSKAHLINIWTQVGEYFADYDNRLVFESMNECLNPNLSDKWHGDAESFEVINKLNQVFVNTVRSQAWNRNRFLLVPTYAAGSSIKVTSAFIIPRDNVKDRLIVEVHVYNTTVAKLKETQASIRANLIERGFPVFLGEYGIKPSEVTDETERLNLLQLQTKMFREMGAGVCIWDNGNGSYKFLNRKTYEFYYPDIVNGIIKSSNKHDFVKLPCLDENYNIKDISNWKEGKIGHSDGEYDSSVTHYFTSDQHLIPRYSSYIVSMNDHSNDRLLVVHRDKNMKMIGGVETKTNGGTITISANDRYIDFCYYNKSTTSTLTKEQFAEYINNGYLQINKADNATQNFEIIEQPLNEALIDLDKRIGNGSNVDLSDYAKTADVNTSLSNKVDKVDGKGLSTNDYTTEEKTKVGKIKTDGNGKEFLANNGNYVGIYSKKEIDDLLYPILNPYKAPIVNLSASGTLFKVGTTNLVTFTADITKGRDDIKSIKFVDGTDTILKEITDKTELAKTTQTHTLSMTTTGTVKVIVSDGISAVEKSVTVTYTYDSYYGIISADKTSLTSDEIKSLNTKLTTDKYFKYDKINLDNQKIAYAYLKSRGALTKILDANNFDYLNSYTRSEVNIDGQEYYLYILTKATVIDGFKQIYQ